MSENKIKHGQFYTVRNPFDHPLIKQWVAKIVDIDQKTFAEPFAGSNNIIKLIIEAYPQIKHRQWKSYDIEPEAVLENQVPEVALIEQDTILNPVSADVIITNPPYLAKNSASFRGYKIDFKEYQNLYEIAVNEMLQHANYVLAIIPESFLTRGNLFKDRLYGFISITDSLFDDTGIPVGIALWTPEEHKDFVVYVGNQKIGFFHEIKEKTKLFKAESQISPNIKVTFNDPAGILGVRAIDNTVSATLAFVPGNIIMSSAIKHTSRHNSRLTVTNTEGNPLITPDNLSQVILQLNQNLNHYREETSDLFLTSSKGIRKDGKYRRRLDFKTIVLLLKTIKY